MKLLRKIRSSCTIQLTLWVAGFLVIISGVVLYLFVSFSQDLIKEETIETTKQALENTALRINNAIQQAEMTAKLENKSFSGDKTLIEKMIKDYNFLITLNKQLPNARLYATDDPKRPNQSGHMHMLINGEPYYVFYEPIHLGDNPHSIVISCPANEINSQFTKMNNSQLRTSIVGIIILIFICWKIIGIHLGPLHKLADSAQRMIDGHVDETFTINKHTNEIAQLQNSLSRMQHSLREYMKEMEEKRATLSRQNDQLQESYSKAQEYENLKSLFVNQMTNQMTAPVQSVCKNTETICKSYQRLSEEELLRLQSNILSATDTITHLLDQLLNTPSQKKSSS